MADLGDIPRYGASAEVTEPLLVYLERSWQDLHGDTVSLQRTEHELSIARWEAGMQPISQVILGDQVLWLSRTDPAIERATIALNGARENAVSSKDDRAEQARAIGELVGNVLFGATVVVVRHTNARPFGVLMADDKRRDLSHHEHVMSGVFIGYDAESDELRFLPGTDGQVIALPVLDELGKRTVDLYASFGRTSDAT